MCHRSDKFSENFNLLLLQLSVVFILSNSEKENMFPEGTAPYTPQAPSGGTSLCISQVLSCGLPDVGLKIREGSA